MHCTDCYGNHDADVAADDDKDETLLGPLNITRILAISLQYGQAWSPLVTP